jgi:cysteine desulfurase / selenocysteine lyase
VATSVGDGRYAADFGPFDGRSWFNTAHQGPLPKVAVQAAQECLSQRVRPSEIRDADFFEVPQRLRDALASLIGAASADIILGNSTSYGLDLLANGIRWERGDEILLVEGDFPADIYPWFVLREKGVEIRFCEFLGPVITAEGLEKEISGKTRLFCTSWVNSFTGHAIDVAALGRVCRDRGVLFVLNASQALGACVLDIQGTAVDAVTCCGYKWMCGPYGTGFCWLTPPLRESLVPHHAYWLPMQAGKPLDQMRDCTLRQDLGARALDIFCTANFFNFVPWTACLNYILEAGPERIAVYDQQIVEKVVRGLDRDRFELLSPESGASRSPLIVIRPLNLHDGLQWQQRLARAGVDVAVREGNLRIAPHLHNTLADADRLLTELAS